MTNRLCVFEDSAVALLEPLTLTRAAFELRCGAGTLLERQQRFAQAGEAGVLVRPALAELCRLEHPDFAVNDRDWLRAGPTVFVSSRWLPPDQPLEDLTSPRVGVSGSQLAYVILPAPGALDSTFESIDDWAQTCLDTLPRCPAGGVMANYSWDLVENNTLALCQDFLGFRQKSNGHLRTGAVSVMGPADQLLVHGEARIEPLVAADTRSGPVLIDEGAVIQSFSRLEGPCYIGRETWVAGAKLRAVTAGPSCRLGGEVEASVIQGYTNKYHDGFLGHSYLGEWVNIGAGTQVSDLRNDYGSIKASIGGERLNTGLTKAGVYMGDHSKTGLGTLINSGTVVGAFSNLLPSGSFLPAVIPSFCTVRYGQLQVRTDLRQMFNTAATVMRRRDRELTGTHIDFFFELYDDTEDFRGRVIRESEQRRLRRIV